MIKKETISKFYPDRKYDGTAIFYNWIRENIEKDFLVLNLGAGSTADRKIRSLKGEVKSVYGADIDKEIFSNKDLDYKFLIEQNTLPFESNFFNLIWSDYVLEHVSQPKLFLSEVYRTLKPGGFFFFRTPNKCHYVSVIARTTPYWFHKLVANKLRGLNRDEYNIYPTYYKLNSKRAISKLSTEIGFKSIELRFIETEPSYLVFHIVPFMFGLAYERLVNKFSQLYWIRANILGRLTK